MRRTIIAALAVSATLVLGACGSSSSSSSGSASGSSTSAGGGAGRPCDAPKVTGKPAVTVPAAPATELQITDDKVGTGPAATADSTVTVNYVGCGQISAKQFDSSWDNGNPATFGLNEVIPGWSKGLLGMKVGGRRTLVIPGALAYGANPPDTSIAPNETLVFVVDLVRVG